MPVNKFSTYIIPVILLLLGAWLAVEIYTLRKEVRRLESVTSLANDFAAKRAQRMVPDKEASEERLRMLLGQELAAAVKAEVNELGTRLEARFIGLESELSNSIKESFAEVLRSERTSTAMQQTVSEALAVAIEEEKQKQYKLSRTRAMQNNLRQIASAALQYILETGETSVSYDQLVPTFFSDIEPVAGENYRDIIIYKDSERIEITTKDGEVIDYLF